ncbi:hypothetical protein [Cohnella sp. WQ 127256]|uniref:hypothetical protein n=1 Tax=Cohnella sp. WQ 127256 TaxID=2938790 RepID=UPI00211833FC|nr:hypothetical protein [Cohnella sp. WQ 127256]
MMNIKIRNMILFFIVIVGVVITITWRIGLLGLWNEGMSYIVNNTKDYSDKDGRIIQENYTISINLSDLKSNIGKVLYDDGNHKIYIAWVSNSGNINSGGYSIGFRSSGQYSLSGATLISGVHHITLGDHSFTSEMSAQMTAEYKSKKYSSSTSGISGLNYKDGDDFSFYIFPLTAYETNEVSLNETGEVNITISNLFKNIWIKS